MNKELLQQYQTLRNTDAVVLINIETQAGCTKVANRAIINKIMDLIIHELMKEEAHETSSESNV